MVRLGHMECLVGNGEMDAMAGEQQCEEEGDQHKDKDDRDHSITFLYTLGAGTCPKSFGINVARLAGLPEAVLQRAKRISAEFEEQVHSGSGGTKGAAPMIE